MHPGHSTSETTVEWPVIGTIGEVVVAVSRTGDAETAAGRAFIDVSFVRLSELQKLAARALVRIGGNLVAALLGMVAAALVATMWKPSREPARPPGHSGLTPLSPHGRSSRAPAGARA